MVILVNIRVIENVCLNLIAVLKEFVIDTHLLNFGLTQGISLPHPPERTDGRP